MGLSRWEGGAGNTSGTSPLARHRVSRPSNSNKEGSFVALFLFPFGPFMNRRDFLHPRRLAETAGQILGALGEISNLPAEVLSPSDEISLLHMARRAMATTFELIVP